MVHQTNAGDIVEGQFLILFLRTNINSLWSLISIAETFIIGYNFIINGLNKNLLNRLITALNIFNADFYFLSSLTLSPLILFLLTAKSKMIRYRIIATTKTADSEGPPTSTHPLQKRCKASNILNMRGKATYEIVVERKCLLH